MSDDTGTPDRSRVVGVGLGAGWDVVMATLMDGDFTTGLTTGAAAGLVIALLAGELADRQATG